MYERAFKDMKWKVYYPIISINLNVNIVRTIDRLVIDTTVYDLEDQYKKTDKD